MAELSATTLGLVPSPVSYLTLLKSGIRLLGMLCTYENPLLWSHWLGKRNPQADLEGPFYIIGSPKREVEKGKAIIAPIAFLKKFRPFLMTVRVLAPDGSPVPGAILDWWQADSEGIYYATSYTLRGRIETDDQGYAEVLTVAPGAYGPVGNLRAGHCHVWIHAPSALPGKQPCDDLTTQLYVCDRNDSKMLETDFVNYFRKARVGNVMQAWSLPHKDVNEGRSYKGFPALAENDDATQKRVEWWNAKLTQFSEPGLAVIAGATTEIRLNAKSGWF